MNKNMTLYIYIYSTGLLNHCNPLLKTEFLLGSHTAEARFSVSIFTLCYFKKPLAIFLA